MDVSFRISDSCCNLFSCEAIIQNMDMKMSPIKLKYSALELDVYNMNGAENYEPGSEFYQFEFTDSDNSTKGNIAWNEM